MYIFECVIVYRDSGRLSKFMKGPPWEKEKCKEPYVKIACSHLKILTITKGSFLQYIDLIGFHSNIYRYGHIDNF